MIADFRLSSASVLPQEYINFLKFANGGEGFIGLNSYVILWRLEELQELNEAYHVFEFAPRILLIGSDGGGEAYGFDMSVSPPPIVKVPFVGMDRDSAVIIAGDFNSFLDILYKTEQD